MKNVINNYALAMMSHLIIMEVHWGGTLVPSQKGRKLGIKETNIGLFVDRANCL